MAALLGYKSTKKTDSKIAFGSQVERKFFPVDTIPTKLGIEHSLRGDPHRGPGCYGDHPVNFFLHPLNLRPRSIRGYGFGARRAKRLSITHSSNASYPGPADYQSTATSLDTTEHSFKPFNSATQRLKQHSGSWDNLGPGSHDHDISRNRKVVFEESFGGPRILKKPITTKCTKGIPDKCGHCGEVPVGDYYENMKHALCRPCYDQLSKDMVTSGALKGLRKVRDCSAIHKHDFPGTAPKTIIMSEKDQKKLQYREAYMSLYYS